MHVNLYKFDDINLYISSKWIKKAGMLVELSTVFYKKEEYKFLGLGQQDIFFSS